MEKQVLQHFKRAQEWLDHIEKPNLSCAQVDCGARAAMAQLKMAEFISKWGVPK